MLICNITASLSDLVGGVSLGGVGWGGVRRQDRESKMDDHVDDAHDS